MNNTVSFVQHLSNGTAQYTESTGAGLPDAQAVLAQWEKDNHVGDGQGDDSEAVGMHAEQGSTSSGQTLFYVVANHAETTSESTSTHYDDHPQVRAAGAALQAGDVEGAQVTFAAFLNDAWMADPNLNINALVQAVLRNSYKDNQQDLKDYALKVEFYNNVKKSIRAEIARARAWQSKYATNSSSGTIPAFIPAASINTNYEGSTSVSTFAGTASSTPVGNGVTQVDPASVQFNPPLGGSASDWRVYKTQDNHYIAVNFNQRQQAGEMRVYEPGTNGQPGAMTLQSWGDPHLNTSGQNYQSAGNGAAGFNEYGRFGVVLPDGTTVSCGCSSGDGSVPVINSIDIVSGSNHYSVISGANQVGTSSSTDQGDGQAWLQQNSIGTVANGGILALHDTTGSSSTAEIDVLQSGGYQVVANQNNTMSTATLSTTGGAQTTLAQQAVANGQQGQITTANDLNSYISNEEELLTSVGDDAQLAQVDLQNMAQNQQQTLQTLSNLSKSFNDVAMAVIRNIQG